MKKFMRNLIVLLTLFLLVTPPVLASGYLDYITDEADLLTENKWLELNEMAIRISEQYECDIAVVILEDLEGSEAYKSAEDTYEENEMGYGADRSILLFLLSMEDRDFALISHGFGDVAFTEYGKKTMLEDKVLPLLGEDKYAEALTTYYEVAEEYLTMASAGTPFNQDTDPAYQRTLLIIKFLLVVLLPLIIAGIVVWIWRGQMKTAVSAVAAAEYVLANSLEITRERDTFLYSEETRRIIEKSGSGGSIGRSGGSGVSGKF